MKKIFAFMAVAAIFASCTKELGQNEVAGNGSVLVPVTLSASLETDTKAALDSDGKSVVWEGTESIAVFDDINTDIHKFDANGDGATTSFSGTANSGAASFVAVYPYKASITYVPGDEKPINAEIPNVQEATLGTFDPAAALYVADADASDAALSFKAAFALLKVNVDVPNVLSISVENTKNNLSGSVKTNSSGGVANGDGAKYKNVTLTKEDGTALAQGIYYIVVRHLGSTSVYENFIVSYATSTGISGSRAAGDDIDNLLLGRKAILNLGNLSAFPASKSYYALYESGADIKIGSTTINKATNGAATLLTADNAAVALNKTSLETGGVFFLKAVGTGSFSNANNPTITNKTYLIADSDDIVPIAMTNTINLADEGELCIKGVHLSMSGKKYYMSVNKNTSKSMNTVVLDGCEVEMKDICANVITTNSSYASYGVNNIEFVNSKFTISVAANLVNISSGYAGITEYKSMRFENNYVYSTTGENILTCIFAYTGTGGDGSMTAVINNNLFYNACNAGTFKHNTIASATAKNNVFWVSDGTSLGDSNGKLFGMKTAAAIASVDVKDNVAYGTLSPDGKKWTIADNTTNTGMEALEVATGDPIASADTATGTFTLVPAYTAYGPQE